MADRKISQLTSAATPLAGTEELPLVQSGTTKKVSVENLTQGRQVRAAELTLQTGNLIIGTAGRGIDFSADPNTPGMTSELLNDYEEGTWTVAAFDGFSGGNQSPTTITGYYTKIGRQVTCSFLDFNDISTVGMTAGNVLSISLPFTAGGTVGTGIGALTTEVFNFTAGRTYLNPTVQAGQTRAQIFATGTGVSNNFITVAAITTGVSDIERFTLTYFTS